MRLSFIGAGYAGLVNAVGFSTVGNHVVCVDIDQKKTEQINEGKTPIFEEGLEEKLKDSLAKKTISATLDMERAILETDTTFVAVGTPSNADGSIDLQYIRQASVNLGKILAKKNGYHLFIMKSTVVPGTTENVLQKELEKNSGKKAGKDFGIAMVPEFLKEGMAMHDFYHPDRIVIGAEDDKVFGMLEELHKGFKAPIVKTDIKTAEMIKYASNAFLATKVTFSNEIGNICKKLGIDVYDVMEGIGLDDRIGKKFLKAGAGFGGSCFPKDVKALVAKSKDAGYAPRVLESVLAVNHDQPLKMVELLRKHTVLDGTKIAVLGLAFKPGTDDMREAAAIPIIETLVEEKSHVIAYDPKAMHVAKKIFGDKITYASSVEDAVRQATHVLLITEWPQFRDEKLYEGKVVIDGRKVLNKKTNGNYEGLCW